MTHVDFSLVFKIVIGTVVSYLYYRFKKIEEKAEKSLSEEEVRKIIEDKTLSEAKVRQIIEDKIKPVENTANDVREDIHRLHNKIDRLIERSQG